jgi:hypothetical protein
VLDTGLVKNGKETIMKKYGGGKHGGGNRTMPSKGGNRTPGKGSGNRYGKK